MQIPTQTITFSNPSLYRNFDKEDVAKGMGLKGELDHKNEVYGMKSGDFLKLNFQERAKAGFRITYPLTGYTRDEEAKVSIIGKLKGYDPNFTSEQIDDLKKFINDSKSLGIDFNWKIDGADRLELANSKEYYLVDSFIEKYSSDDAAIGIGELEKNSKTVELLDSDLSIDEFKIEWAKHTLKERFDLTLSDEDAKNIIDILKELNDKNIDSVATNEDKNKNNQKEFKPIQGESKNKETYKYEATNELRELFRFVKEQYDNGKSMFDIFKMVAENRIDIRA